MKKLNRRLLWILVGSLFILAGLQLRVCESFVLRPETTRILARWKVQRDSSPGAMLQRTVTANLDVRKTLTPPNWLGWASLSAGIAAVANGCLRHGR